MRTERDSMGEMEVPDDAMWGAQTQRAVLNFPISDLRFPRSMIRALGLLKQAAAEVNLELGVIDQRTADAIIKAAREVADGSLDNHFVVDIFQTGSGTSSNMNVNEVIANRATQILGGEIGSRMVHPNDHVNQGQSSNDIIPTAIQLAAAQGVKDMLIPAIERLTEALERKSDEFMPTVKTGRTHLQDATPIRLGQEFLGYAGQMERAVRRARHALEELSEVPLGGTAVGTGINAHPEFAERVCNRLAEITGVSIHETSNHFQAQSTIKRAGRGQRRDEHHRREHVEDRQRRALAGVRTARRDRRDLPARGPAGVVDHAGQSEPGHRGVGLPSSGAGDRQPRYGDYRRRAGKQLPAKT